MKRSSVIQRDNQLIMKDLLSSLNERTAEFGNHYRKYLHTVSKYLDPLIQRLELRKKRLTIHLLHPAYDFPSEIKIVANVAETTEEKLNFIGTFFSLQLLLMNRQVLDMLRMEIFSSGQDRFEIYKSFMRRVGDSFRMLTASYISELIAILSPADERPEFVILGVGTKSDQDDIDVGIVDDGSKDREKFNRAIAQVSREMLRYATSFHFHLSEHIGSQHYSASIEEYKKVLEHEIRDFVIINEMLSAALIVGSHRLFEEYKQEIIERYFYHPDGNNKYHEGYLRGILGEISSLIARPLSAHHINFKEDALRAIKSIISAQKTIFNVKSVNAWDIIDELRRRDKDRTPVYNALERSLTFFEIFRYLYQLFVTQDEEVFFDEVTFQNLHKIARVLGYRNFGKCRAEEHLLVHYYEHIQTIRRVIPLLVEDIKRQLKLHSKFSGMFKNSYHGNIAQDFIKEFRFFRGTSFWDDILDDFKTDEILKRFIDNLNSLSPPERKKIIKEYVEWVRYDFYSSVKFLTILGMSKKGRAVYQELNSHLLKIIGHIPDSVRNIAAVFYRYPGLINSYLSLNDESNLRFLWGIFEGKVYEGEITEIINNLKNLVAIHLQASQFFKRYFLISLEKYPEAIELLNKPHCLKELAEAIYSDVSSMRSFSAKKEKLGDYYDFEMMRVGLGVLQRTAVQTTNAEFIEFSDRYIHILFDICRQEVDQEYPKRILTEDVLAIFAAGGHACEQAFDDDYDLIVLLNSCADEVLTYCNKIISKMNAEIIKRGTIPHHRFAEYFGRFVVRLSEIEQLLNEDRADIFIEKSQLLGARLIIGSHRFEKEFLERIIKPYIFDKKKEYIKQMVNEIAARHRVETENLTNGYNIKEAVGGLRDIEMLMLIIKACFSIKEPVNTKLFEAVGYSRSEIKNELYKLSEAFLFLKNLRDVYRLTIAATDTIFPEALNTVGAVMGYKNSAELINKFKAVTKEVAETIHQLLGRFGNL